MIRVQSKEAFSIRVERDLRDHAEHKVDLCLFVPSELAVSATLISEQQFYHQAIHIRRTYYSRGQLEPLVRSRLIQRMSHNRERPDPNYRLSLSLYGYQYVNALEREVTRVLRDKVADKRGALADIIELSSTILRRLRRTAPSDDILTRYYTNIDNYLSWFTSQQFLRLAAELEFSRTEQDIRELLLSIARREDKYRETREYNSLRLQEDSTRLSNKMRLLRRLIEHPVTLQRNTQELGHLQQKFLKAGVAAVVMTLVSFSILQARDNLGDVTLLFILLLAVLYGMRELFKDDIREKIWHWLRKGRPKWKHALVDPNSEQTVGKALEWFDFKNSKDLPTELARARRGGSVQQTEMVWHYTGWSKMETARFLSGYGATREVITLDLELLAPFLEQTTFPIYRREGADVIRDDVEKRYVFNLITREQLGEEKSVQRWKIMLNRHGILEIEEGTL